MYRFIKRIIDISISLVVILILSPILLPVVIGLLLTGEHYVFYFQERIGFKKKRFNIYKFATMLKDSPNIGSGLHTTKKDPRILPMGGFLRKTKINELPQLFNILFGSMSIVGPRPLVDKTFNPYSDYVKENIYNVKPGLTGIGSVVFRDEEELLSQTKMPLDEFYSKHISPYKGELEIWYQKNISFITDMKIIFLTAWAIIFPKTKLTFRIFKDLPQMPKELNIK
ncbi:MAG: sugar transferase [Marinifilaceae bacterium]|jgi:lipopolysaccharide/colanic/teichoic acid biosynthesis glycosyltransferase|nr:sugar transferase [Marinifilaceae bacterium]